MDRAIWRTCCISQHSWSDVKTTAIIVPLLSDSLLNKCLQPRQRRVPLARNALNVLFNLAERARVEFESALSPLALASHHPRPLQHAQVFCDRLPRQPRLQRQFRNRRSLARGQPRQERQPRLIAQRGKHNCGRRPPRSRLTRTRQGKPRYSSSAAPIRHRCS